MKVAIIGSGGREHALAMCINKSKKLSKLFCLPGNPGTKKIAENITISNPCEIVAFCVNEKIDLVIIGPEQPLVDGLADMLAEKSIHVFGPSKRAAILEGDKSLAKELMKKYSIPTAQFKVFENSEIKECLNYLTEISYPVVIKVSGLAAGKGVMICADFKEAAEAVKDIFIDKKFGTSGNKIVIEEFLEGEEVSIFAITDGLRFILLPVSQDHKRAMDGDKGKNTGGMGAYAPSSVVDENMLEIIENDIINPTIIAMNKENRKYLGCLYAGLMITNTGPKVIEFNCRFGDPETQVVLPLLNGDLLNLLNSAALGDLDMSSVEYNNGAAVCIVAVSEGYPDYYDTGFEITGLDTNYENIIIYHAGTKEINNQIITSGGRVLGVTSVITSNNIRLAKQTAYNALNKIYFKGITYRRDIADREINRKK